MSAAQWLLLSGWLVACGSDPVASDAPPHDSDPSTQPLALRFEPIALEGGAPEAITELAFIPGTSELLVANKTHTVTHYRLEPDAATATRLGSFDVPGVVERADCGLLAMAFDPDFVTNRLIYFAACDSITHSRITRHVFDPSDGYASIASTTALVTRVGSDSATVAWHNIGSIGFDASGYLWALFGDKNLGPTSQDLTSQLGTVIRIVPDRIVEGHAPAPTNPVIEGGHDPDIAAYGLRSPWRGAMDSAGRLWIGDVGEETFEEVNISRFAGENFGNSIAEGPCTGAACAGLVDPVVYWDRDNGHRYAREDPQLVPTIRRVVWVGAEYPRSIATDRYAGRLFDRMLVGDFNAGWIRAIGLDAEDRVIADQHVGHLESATKWAVGPDGYLYVTTYGGALAWPYEEGALWRAVAVD